MWCWRRLWRVPWTARRSNQSILKEISPGCSLEGLMLKLKFQYFGHLMRRADSFEKTLMLGKIEGKRRRGHAEGWDGWMASLTRCMWVWVNSGSWWWTGRPGMLRFMGSQRVNWTELTCIWCLPRAKYQIWHFKYTCLSNQHNNSMRKILLLFLLFPEEETKAQRGYGICPKSHS